VYIRTESQIPTVLFHLIVLCFSGDMVRQDRCKLVSRPVYVYIGLGVRGELTICAALALHKLDSCRGVGRN